MEEKEVIVRLKNVNKFYGDNHVVREMCIRDRTAGKDDFEYDDIFLLDLLKDHMAYRLYKSKKSGNVLDEKLTVSAAVEEYELTRREETILRLLMAGEENAVICTELMITANTLKKHILNIYRKLGIKNRVQLFKMIKEKE